MVNLQRLHRFGQDEVLEMRCNVAYPRPWRTEDRGSRHQRVGRKLCSTSIRQSQPHEPAEVVFDYYSILVSVQCI